MSPTNWKHLLHRIGIWTCWLLRRRENRSKGASSAVLLKVGAGGGGRWYQSTPERNFKLKLFFLVQTRRNVKIVLQLPQNVARARAYAIWLVLEKFTSADLSQIALITDTNITVLGIIGKKEEGGWGRLKNEKSKDYCEADLKQRVLFLEVKGMLCSVFTAGQSRLPGLFPKNCRHIYSNYMTRYVFAIVIKGY